MYLSKCFNALAGIFCFLAIDMRGDDEKIVPMRFNALAGIFCFLAVDFCFCGSRRLGVSMPSRAFFVFWQNFALPLLQGGTEFQCPRGHFLFSGKHRGRNHPLLKGHVSMPSRAFFVFWHCDWYHLVPANNSFQCPRGHFLFSGHGAPGRHRCAG